MACGCLSGCIDFIIDGVGVGWEDSEKSEDLSNQTNRMERKSVMTNMA